jgi:hypothetical protein
MINDPHHYSMPWCTYTMLCCRVSTNYTKSNVKKKLMRIMEYKHQALLLVVDGAERCLRPGRLRLNSKAVLTPPRTKVLVGPRHAWLAMYKYKSPMQC